MQIIIILLSEISFLSSLSFYIIDPFHGTGILYNSAIYYFIEINPIPLMVNNTTFIAVIWHQMMINDFNMNHEQWKKRVLYIFVISSVIIYPLLMISINLFSTIFQLWYLVLVVVVYMIIIIGCFTFYIYNLIRIVIRIKNNHNIPMQVKFRHLDKFIIVGIYIIITAMTVIIGYFYTVAVNVILMSILLLIVNINNLLYIYLVRVPEKKNNTTSKSIKDQTKSSNKSSK